ncbi:hypothetical protein A6A04_09985 [Paramagnetospirillum marisnigri]|uniref:Flagellar basal body rod protein N-terminal domain-containing protein n=1 Tax=Paramagnetospirillum marisnigri TaxID=1285242 RepID=A0A178M4M7_9PROT|nr:hypothetical protein [Paramagnetospirillum marisnigri]OAN43016.1 hypothetical protein A6A04_09985 [Paramagnetospirillum marisnigri]
MISSVSLATLATGLEAQSRVANTAATNIVNATTPGYQAEQGQLVSRPLNGAGYVPLPPEGEVDLGTEMVNLVLAKTSYGAAAKAFARIAETESKALDTLA